MGRKIKIIISMLVFGTLGVFVHYIHLPSSELAALRAMIGSIFLVVYMASTDNKINRKDIEKDLKLLIPSGIMLGFMWIFLFQAYRLSTVAIATLCHYMAPILVMVLSPIFFKEKLNGIKILCIAAAVAGIVFVSGLTGGSSVHISGILFGLFSAAFYAGVIIMNKFIRNLPPAETTFCQLFIASILLSIYTLLTGGFSREAFSGKTVLLILIIGIVHTGITYLMFFDAVESLEAQTTAVLSYIDPITAILLSTFLLHQSMSPVQWGGAALILGSTFFYEIFADGIWKRPHDHIR
ncbi:MAG: DMT family transporter [Gallicola sp.]|nr:DMT family transporter [Gallicola sp.]